MGTSEKLARTLKTDDVGAVALDDLLERLPPRSTAQMQALQ